MQLIPVLVPGKMKTMEASQHFLDVREDTASMAEAIRKPKWTFPYILRIGRRYRQHGGSHKKTEEDFSVYTPNWGVLHYNCFRKTFHISIEQH
jgi:hypothetical protein